MQSKVQHVFLQNFVKPYKMSLGIESSFYEKAKLKLTGKVTCAIRTPAVDRSVSLVF